MAEKRIVRRYAAGEDLNKGDAVFVHGDHTVQKTDANSGIWSAVRLKGVAEHKAKQGDQVYVVILGPVKGVSDAVIDAGDPVELAIYDNGTPGRVKAMQGYHSHLIGDTDSADGSVGQHTHGNPAAGANLEAGYRRFAYAESSTSGAGEEVDLLVGV